MTLPTIVKTWQFNVNQSIGGTGSFHHDCSSILYEIKESLKGFASNPWLVWGSCNGAGGFGNNDGNDRWTPFDAAYSKFVWAAAGSNHSWMVLEQTGLGGAQFCIDLSNANPYWLSIIFSPGGQFGAPGSGGTGADGTATARPTAGDELVLINNTVWGTSTGSSTFYSKGLHVIQSSDGQCTRAICCINNFPTLMWIFDKAKNPIAAWTAPYFAAAVGADNYTTNVVAYAYFNDGAYGRSRIGADGASFYMTSAWYTSATLGENQAYPDDDTIEWPLSPIGLACFSTPHRGTRKGEVFDLWWGSIAPQLGATYPADASRQFAQIGHLIFPWDGLTSPKTA